MAKIGNYLREKILEHLRGNAFTSPTTVQIGAHTSNPGADGTTGELSGNGYARVTLGSGGLTTFSAGANRQTANVGAFAFPSATASWGLVTHLSVWSGTDFLFPVTLQSSVNINTAGDVLTIAAGTLIFRWPGGTGTDGFSDYYANGLLDHIFRNVAFSPPTNAFNTLFNSDPGAVGASGEVTTNGAARVQLMTGGVTFTAATDGEIESEDDIVHGPADGGAWNTISHVAWFNNGSFGSGNMLLKAAAQQARDILEGETWKCLTGNFTVAIA